MREIDSYYSPFKLEFHEMMVVHLSVAFVPFGGYLKSRVLGGNIVETGPRTIVFDHLKQSVITKLLKGTSINS